MRKTRSGRAARAKRVFDRRAVVGFVGDDRVRAIPIAHRGFEQTVFVFPNAQFLTIRQETLNVIGEGSCDRNSRHGRALNLIGIEQRGSGMALHDQRQLPS